MDAFARPYGWLHEQVMTECHFVHDAPAVLRASGVNATLTWKYMPCQA